MKDPFLEQEWRDCCERLRRCADHIAGGNDSLRRNFVDEADQFAQQEPPERYPIFLDRVSESATLAVRWQRLRDEQLETSDTSPSIAAA